MGTHKILEELNTVPFFIVDNVNEINITDIQIVGDIKAFIMINGLFQHR